MAPVSLSNGDATGARRWRAASSSWEEDERKVPRRPRREPVKKHEEEVTKNPPPLDGASRLEHAQLSLGRGRLAGEVNATATAGGQGPAGLPAGVPDFRRGPRVGFRHPGGLPV